MAEKNLMILIIFSGKYSLTNISIKVGRPLNLKKTPDETGREHPD